MSPNERIAMNTRRQAFMLAGALTATVFTAAAALAGVSHRPASASKPAATPTPVVQQVAPQPVRASEWGDD
jgi:hypothetical protein